MRREFCAKAMLECYTLGTSEEEALFKIEKLLEAGSGVISDPVGEEVKNSEDVGRAVTLMWEHMVKLGALKGKHPNQYLAVAIKPSRFGAKFDLWRAKKVIRVLYVAAQLQDLGFELDMEGRELMRPTLDIARSLLREGNIHWLAIQANQSESVKILERAIQSGLHRFRIVLGAYQGDIQKRKDIFENYLLLVRRAAEYGADIALATHNSKLIREGKEIAPDAKTQMLYGVRMKLQTALWSLSRLLGKCMHDIYCAWGERRESVGFLERRMQEGIRLNVLFLFLRNKFESEKWRRKFFPHS